MKRDLRKELLQEGAGKNEAETLARLGTQLNSLKLPGLSARAKQRIFDKLPMDAPRKPRPMFRWAMAGSLAGAMALVALVVVPSLLQSNPALPAENDVRTLVQPIETELQQLDMQIEELQQQETINEAELQEAEEKYRRTFEDFKKKYQNDRKFKNYDWNKWRREWLNSRDRKNNDSNDRNNDRTNGASSIQKNWYSTDR